jgi:hypothetical protein
MKLAKRKFWIRYVFANKADAGAQLYCEVIHDIAAILEGSGT